MHSHVPASRRDAAPRRDAVLRALRQVNALRQRIQTGAEEQRVARQQDLERLLRRYHNIKVWPTMLTLSCIWPTSPSTLQSLGISTHACSALTSVHCLPFPPGPVRLPLVSLKQCGWCHARRPNSNRSKLPSANGRKRARRLPLVLGWALPWARAAHWRIHDRCLALRLKTRGRVLAVAARTAALALAAASAIRCRHDLHRELRGRGVPVAPYDHDIANGAHSILP